ncbi:unnamed protein product [Closterium sp. Yama58-4]|nr:unnamed protein product [Closterium sp. Yama58-4]
MTTSSSFSSRRRSAKPYGLGETHYDALCIARSASLDEIRRNFQEAALLLHPDKQQQQQEHQNQEKEQRQLEGEQIHEDLELLVHAIGDGISNGREQRFQRVHAAWSALRDSSTRAEYDRVLIESDKRAAALALVQQGCYSRSYSAGCYSSTKVPRTEKTVVAAWAVGSKRGPPPDLMPKEELLSTCKFPGAINLTISPEFIGTTWRGWGTSLSWFANYVGGLPQQQLTAMLDLIFDPINGLGLNIVRYNIGGGHNETLSPQFHQSLQAYWRGMPGYKPTRRQWEPWPQYMAEGRALSKQHPMTLLEIAAHAKTVTATPGNGSMQSPPPYLEPKEELLPTCKFPGEINLTISADFIGTTWRGWGTSLGWFANYVGGLPQRQLTAILDLIFDPINGLGLNIVRYNIGGGHNDTLSPQFNQSLEAHWRGMPGYKPAKDGPYDWNADERQRNVLLGAKARGANVFEAFSNSPPWWMTVTGDVGGAVSKGETNMLPEYEDDFADYLTTVVAEFAKRWRVTFDALEPFNEALEEFWKTGDDHEGCTFNQPEMGRVIKYTSDSLQAKGLTTKLVGVDSWDGTTAQLPKISNHELLTRINVHAYINQYFKEGVDVTYEVRYGSIRDTAKQLGREVWVSEAGALGKNGSNWDLALYMARNVIESVNIMEASAYLMWQAYDFAAHWSCIDFPPDYPPRYSGEMMMPTMNKRFWIFKHFTMLAKPGSKPLKNISAMVRRLFLRGVFFSVFLALALLEFAAHPKTVTAARRAGGADGNKRAPPPDLLPAIELLSTCKSKGAINITVSPEFVGTTWRGWGTSLAWFANYVGGLPQQQLTAILDLIFEPINGLGLNIVRYNIGGGHHDERSPQFHQNSEADWRGIPGYKPTKDGPYDWSADKRQRNVLLGAKERGANVFEAFSNSPPWWMTVTGDVAGAVWKGATNLLPEYEKAFADYLTTVVAEFAKRWKLKFDALEPFNEALEGFWKAGKEHEGCTFNPPEMGRVIKYTSDSLKAKKVKTKLVGVDSWDGMTAQLPQIANHELLTRINVHAYVNSYHDKTVAATYEKRFGTIRDTAKQLGREVWVSEAGALSKRGSNWDLSLYMARNVIESVNIMEASAYMIWQAYDFAAHWSCIDFPPNYPANYTGEMEMPRANKRFWIFKHFTFLAGPGSKPLKIGSDCWHGMSAFYNPGEKRVTVFVVNQKAEDRHVTINLDGFTMNVGGTTKVVVRRTTWSTDFTVKVYRKQVARLTVWGQSLASVTFTNVSY